MRVDSIEDHLKGGALLVKCTYECVRPFKRVKDPGFIDFFCFLTSQGRNISYHLETITVIK